MSVALIGAVWLAVGPALAVSPAAEALFQDGRRLLAAGNFKEACARFSESYAAEASSGTLLNLAHCHEKLGMTATAWAEYRVAARLARKQNRDDRAAVADEKAAALETDLARLTAIPSKVVPGLHVETEAGSLGEGGFGVAVPIDPGTHKVTVTAPGYRPWTTTVQLEDHEQRTLTIPEMSPIPTIPADIPKTAPGTGVMIETVPLERAAPAKTSSLGLDLAGGGGALLLGGTAAWLIAYAEFQTAKDVCNTGAGCTAADRSDRIGTIERLQTFAVGSWIAGGALLAASGVHYLLRRGSSSLAITIDPMNNGLAAFAAF